MERTLTGRHVAIIFVSFFAVVITVNIIMARFAISSFGGVVVDNSYVASQHFNERLEQGRHQRALGWHPRLTLNEKRHLDIQVSHQGKPVAGLTVTATAHHPLGRAEPVPLLMQAVGDGHYQARNPLPKGRWQIRFDLQQGNNRYSDIEDIL